MRRGIRNLAVVVALLWPSMAVAVQPDEVLADAALEQRARDISQGLRCLVCQNQSIDDSNASLARDLRILVRERLVAGDNDRQVVDYIVARYGHFVLLKPPLERNTVLLWFGPAALMGLALGIAVIYVRRNGTPGADQPQPLSADEQSRLTSLLERDNS